jgi:hypothetical protein
LSIISFQYSFFRTSSCFSTKSGFRTVSHIVVTRVMLWAHCSPQSSPNLRKLRPGFPVIRLSVIRCKYMIPDNEMLLQGFLCKDSSCRSKMKLNQHTTLGASHQSSLESPCRYCNRSLGFR